MTECTSPIITSFFVEKYTLEPLEKVQREAGVGGNHSITFDALPAKSLQERDVDAEAVAIAVKYKGKNSCRSKSWLPERQREGTFLKILSIHTSYVASISPIRLRLNRSKGS